MLIQIIREQGAHPFEDIPLLGETGEISDDIVLLEPGDLEEGEIFEAVPLLEPDDTAFGLEEFLEAEQDEEYKTLDDAIEADVNGLFCGGLASCYAVIFRNIRAPQKTVVAHISSLGTEEGKGKRKGVGELMLIDMYNYATDNGTSECEIIFAKSPIGYKMQYKRDIANKYREKISDKKIDEEMNAYFQKQDALYAYFCREAFTPEPTFVVMPHNFLVIRQNAQIEYFAQYPSGSIGYAEIERYSMNP